MNNKESCAGGCKLATASCMLARGLCEREQGQGGMRQLFIAVVVALVCILYPVYFATVSQQSIIVAVLQQHVQLKQVLI